MKYRHTFSFFTLVSLIVFSLTATSPAAAQRRGPGQAGGECTGGIGALFHEIEIQPLSIEEEHELLFMWEEEKMARDVYLILAEKWQLPIFANIARAEQRHMDLMFRLIEAYGFSDQVPEDLAGVFVDPGLSSLFSFLVSEENNGSLVASLTVGATIEDKDLADLYNLIDYVTDNRHIELVAYNLAKGSRNHLRAFVRALGAQDETYIPSYLDSETYEGILAAGMEQRVFYNADGEPVPACGGAVGGIGMRRGQDHRGGQGNNGEDRQGPNGTGSGECDGSGGVSGECDGSGPHGGGNGSGNGSGS
jgi:hypothetical protein